MTISIDNITENRVKTKEDIISDLETKERLEKVERLLQRISPKQREVFIFRKFDELSYEEISEITGKSVGALKANYFHAFNKLKELIKNE
ncbi:MAG: RNA polymerase sigma factor [Bacteroidetes bacterium]|nr:RNA polymerase sigma factor [Bacteroidota bacterium]